MNAKHYVSLEAAKKLERLILSTFVLLFHIPCYALYLLMHICISPIVLYLIIKRTWNVYPWVKRIVAGLKVNFLWDKRKENTMYHH